MKVLHVVATSQRRGAEVFAADLVAALSELGVEQQVAVLRDGLPPSIEFQVPAVDLSGEGGVVPGVRIAPRAVRELRRAVARFRPGVVQLHGGEPLKYAVAAGLDGRVPLVYRRIGDHRQLRGGAFRTLVYGWLMRRAARVVAVADAVRRELVERFRVPPSRVLTIPNAVDLRRLEGLASKDEAKDFLGLPREARVILSLGALTWEKDPLGHLAVTELVLAEHRDAFHLVVGDGPLRGRVAQAVRAGRFADRIRLLPTQPDVRLPLAAADVLLLASRTEGMPAAAIEAGASGVPVAAYRLSGIPEVVVDGHTGLLAPPGDRIGLAARVLAVLADEALRQRLGAAARERCRSSFDIRVVALRYVQLYRGLED